MKFLSLTCILLLGMAFAGPAPAQSAPRASCGRAENYMQMHQIEANFHQAATDHNLDQMMSLFAKDATVVAFGKTYTGADQIRQFWLSSGPFTHQWVGYTPAFLITYKIAGNTGHLNFDCFYADTQDKKVTAHVDASAVVVLQNGKWLLHEVTFTPHKVQLASLP